MVSGVISTSDTAAKRLAIGVPVSANDGTATVTTLTIAFEDDSRSVDPAGRSGVGSTKPTRKPLSAGSRFGDQLSGYDFRDVK